MKKKNIILLLCYLVINSILLWSQKSDMEAFFKVKAMQCYYIKMFNILKNDSVHIKDLYSNRIFAYGRKRGLNDYTLLEQHLRDMYHGFGYMPPPSISVKKLNKKTPLKGYDIYIVNVGKKHIDYDTIYNYFYYDKSIPGYVGRYVFAYNPKTGDLQSLLGEFTTYDWNKKYSFFKDKINMNNPKSYIDYLDFYFIGMEFEKIYYVGRDSIDYIYHGISKAFNNERKYEIRVEIKKPYSVGIKELNPVELPGRKLKGRQWPLWGVDSLSLIKKCVLNEVMKNIYLYRIQKLRLMDTLKWEELPYYIDKDPPYTYFDSIIPRYNEKLKLEITRIDSTSYNFLLFQVYYPGYDSLYTDTYGYINTFYNKYLDLKPCFYVVAFDKNSMFYFVSGDFYLSRIIPLIYSRIETCDYTCRYNLVRLRMLAYGDFEGDEERRFTFFSDVEEDEKMRTIMGGGNSDDYWSFRASRGYNVYYIRMHKKNPEIVDIVNKNYGLINYKGIKKSEEEEEEEDIGE